MAGQCSATKRNGERCTLPVTGPHGLLCWAHDPKNAEKRRRGASRGGRGKANRDVPAIKVQLQHLVRDVLAGDQPTGPAAVANQLINTRLRAIELERKIREAEEIEERVAALERSIRPRSQGGGRWGA